LTRTTRSVALTEAGERLFHSIGPRFDEIEAEISAVSEWRDKPAGTIRFTTVEHAAETILWPRLAPVLLNYPDINVEIISDYARADIVTDRFDAGVRLGEHVDKDMISMRLGPDFRLTLAASPAYVANRARPQTPEDLTGHACINLRLPTHGGTFTWTLRKGDREVNVRTAGRATFNTVSLMRSAALQGFGIGCFAEDIVKDDIEAGCLVSVLEDWSPPIPGYHLYYPSRRQHSPAFALALEALRYRG
jgi:DNA-binding transcriptional LysR family regulator